MIEDRYGPHAAIVAAMIDRTRRLSWPERERLAALEPQLPDRLGSSTIAQVFVRAGLERYNQDIYNDVFIAHSDNGTALAAQKLGRGHNWLDLAPPDFDVIMSSNLAVFCAVWGVVLRDHINADQYLALTAPWRAAIGQLPAPVPGSWRPN